MATEVNGAASKTSDVTGENLALVWYANKDLRLEKRAIPEPGPNGKSRILIRLCPLYTEGILCFLKDSYYWIDE